MPNIFSYQDYRQFLGDGEHPTRWMSLNCPCHLLWECQLNHKVAESLQRMLVAFAYWNPTVNCLPIIQER